jgi:hypothetical protein
VSIFTRFRKTTPELEFIDVSRSVYHKIPVVPAKDVAPVAKAKQMGAMGSFKFAHCPGIVDYSRLGYIIPAWTDMHILANKAGVVAKIGSENRGNRGFREPVNMDASIVDGFFTPADGVPLTVMKFECPWYIRTSNNISALTLPAWYHAEWLDDLHCWPGSVDYGKFSVTNFICSPKRECHVKIKAGDPLLHIIPFYGRDIVAGYGPGTDVQVDETNNEVYGDQSQFYRRFLSVKKVFSLSGRNNKE